MTNRTVYADSPAAAFSVNAELDQRAVTNYLNSVAQNQRAAQAQFQAQAQVAAERSRQEQQDFQNQLLLAKIPLEQDQLAELRRDRLASTVESRRRFDEEVKIRRDESEWDRKQPTPAQLKIEEGKRIDDDSIKEETAHAGRVAGNKNKIADLDKLLIRIKQLNSKELFDTEKNKLPRSILESMFWPYTDGRKENVKKIIMEKMMAEIPADFLTGKEFDGATDPKSLAERIESFATQRKGIYQSLLGKGDEQLVTFDPKSGSFAALPPRTNSPMSVFTSGTGTNSPKSSLPSGTRTNSALTKPPSVKPTVEQLVMEARAEIKAGRIESEVWKRVGELLKGL